jgi:hypothetical protein
MRPKQYLKSKILQFIIVPLGYELKWHVIEVYYHFTAKKTK